MSIWLQKSASIQPRTSLPKFQAGVSFTLQFHIRIPPHLDGVPHEGHELLEAQGLPGRLSSVDLRLLAADS